EMRTTSAGKRHTSKELVRRQDRFAHRFQGSPAAQDGVQPTLLAGSVSHAVQEDRVVLVDYPLVRFGGVQESEGNCIAADSAPQRLQPVGLAGGIWREAKDFSVKIDDERQIARVGRVVLRRTDDQADDLDFLGTVEQSANPEGPAACVRRTAEEGRVKVVNF